MFESAAGTTAAIISDDAVLFSCVAKLSGPVLSFSKDNTVIAMMMLKFTLTYTRFGMVAACHFRLTIGVGGGFVIVVNQVPNLEAT